MLETTLKSVIGLHEQKSSYTLHELLKKSLVELKLDEGSQDASSPSFPALRKTLNNLIQLVQGIGEIRNLYGTGHGRSKAKEIDQSHAELAINAAIAVATYLLSILSNREED